MCLSDLFFYPQIERNLGSIRLSLRRNISADVSDDSLVPDCED